MYDIIEAIKNKTSYRIRFMHIIMGLLFIMLIVKLYSLQITSGDYYSKEVSGTAIRNVTVSAPRGIIYDRYGREIATNTSSYAVNIDPSIGVDNLNDVLQNLITLLEANNEKIVIDFPITAESPHSFLFNESEKIKYINELKNKINSFINRYTIPDSYNAKSLIAVDLSNNNDFVSKRANEQQTPASLAKLFVIDYATTLVDLDDVVLAKNEAISLTKQGSSVANIKEKKYYVKNLFAAMLVPSGNDAAYVLADYCGGIISPKATTSKERIEVFMKNLNEYLKQNDYKDTILYDPSGFDTEAHTTVLDLKEVVMDLLKNEWFKDIVSQTSYTATLPDGSMQTWKNTNTFLDPTSEYYNKNVIGVKTGSLSDDFNLVVLYKKHGKEFLICSLGSQSNYSRYDDVNYVLKTIDESDYLKK